MTSDASERIDVRVHGAAGPELVVLHGGPGAPGSAQGLARVLAATFRVLEPLQRRSGVEPLSVARHVQDLAEIAPSPSAILGHSWGAMLGLSYAARYPAAVSKLILVGCGTYDEADRAERRQALRERLGVDGRRQVAELRAQLDHETDDARRDAALAQLGALHAQLETYAALPESGEATNHLPVDAQGHTETWDDVLRLQREGVEPAAFARIRMPVLMLHGKHDLHPAGATRDRLRRYIPQLEYLELDRCGHEPWRERHAREPFLAAIAEWLKRPAPSAPP